MSGRVVHLLILVLAVCVLNGPTTAAAQVSAQMPQTPAVGVFTGADVSRPGNVDLTVFAPDGSTAVYYERIGSRRVRLGERTVRGADLARFTHATVWRCDRLVRRFEVDAVGTDGSRYSGAYSVRTPSCRYRFALTLPRRVPRGSAVTVGIRDSWRLGGVKPRLCVAAPGAPARCPVVALRAGQASARYRFTPARTGRWKLRLRLASAGPLHQLAVGDRGTRREAAPAPAVLATGDSTMQGVDGFLAERAGDAVRVVSRVRPATGISKPGSPSWPEAAWIQSSTLRPAATVVSLGVNDGYAMRTPAGRRASCCGEAWTTEYARRARIMMRTWTRFGGHVAWMTLPPPGVAALAPRLAAVNAAVTRAAVALPRVSVVRIDRLMSPSGLHEPTRIIRGKRVKMYLRDELHLSPAGTAIAAEAVAKALRDAGALPRGG